MKTNPRSIEPLESRIAPATFVNATTVIYTDLDGDAVTVKTSTGEFFLAANFAFGPANPAGGEQLRQIFLAGPSADGFDGANLTVSVVKKPGGDGLVNVGEIISDRDLGAVSVKGDLGAIACGDFTTGTGFGLKSLSVNSLGRFGTATGAVANADGTLESHIVGAVGKLVVKGDVANAWLHVTGNGAGDEARGTIGSVTIGGSLIGGSVLRAGAIESTGDLGVVNIRRDIQGGSGVTAGSIQSDLGKIKSVTLGGSLIGGVGKFSGQIRSGNDLGPVKIAGNVQGGSGDESGKIDAGGGIVAGGPATGRIASITIGGSFTGGSGGHFTFIDGNGTQHLGQIFSAGSIGPVKIGRDLSGGSGPASGSIFGTGLASVSIGGSLIGGRGDDSGRIASDGDIGAVKIGHDLRGGSGVRAGHIDSFDKLASVTIGGSLLGGAGSFSAEIDSGGDLGAVRIAHDFIGGSISGTAATLTGSGYIQSSGRIDSVTIGGSIISGTDTSTGGGLTKNASIYASTIVSLTVKGSLLGNASANGNSPVVLAAGSELDRTDNLVIARISIGGRAEFASILGGYTNDLAASNGNAQIGAVKVGGDWISSSIVAGAQDTGAAGFGDAGDTLIPIAGGGASIAKIASIVIGGQVVGTPGAGDRFGFVSHTIGSFKAAGFTAPFTAATGQFFELSLITADVTVREI